MVGFFAVDFLGFAFADCSRTTNSSSNMTAFFGLPRFFTVSLDMAVGWAPLIYGDSGRGILHVLTRAGTLQTRFNLGSDVGGN